MAWQDLRGWLAEVEAIGQLRRVDGASWESDIGRITEMLDHTPNSPCVLFDNIPGYPTGFRVVANTGGTRERQAVTLDMAPERATHDALLERWGHIIDELVPTAPETVSSGPVMENVVEGEDVDITAFPAPQWHPNDGGRYIGTASLNIMRDPDSGW